MSAASVDIRDEVTPALAGLTQALRERVAPAIGAAAVKLFQENFRTLGTNKQGWPSTGFWAQAARATSSQSSVGEVRVIVAKQGVLQRWKGGEITPQKAKWLTIPARAEAYGKTAREFSNLQPAFFKTGNGFFAALVEVHQTAISIGKKGKVKAGKESGGGVMFWLRKSVNQEANPAVVPSEQAITAAATAVVQGIVARATKKT